MDRSLVSVRAALVLLLAALAGAGAGALALLAGHGMAGGVLAGFTTAGGAVPVFNQAIAPDTVDSRPVVREAGAEDGRVRG